ncbi:MAG: DNA-directed RNA polymerase subunit alpha C-terminal domain-containing protein, partial [Candidatus Peribacteraceae bacterium]|nr:DNA-directed RNA polymerase subunit alpha C-terminal domain-containing protein [Candidatus Peribacteraceae bacterium]
MKTASDLSSEARKMHLSQLDISMRSCNTLGREGIHFVEDVTNRTEEELLSIFNFGVKSINELYLALAQVGVRMNGVLVERTGGGDFNGHSRRRSSEPSADDIRARCLEIQASWTESEHQRRLGKTSVQESWLPPSVHIDDEKFVHG